MEGGRVVILEVATRTYYLWKDHEKSAKVRTTRRKDMGIGTGKEHTPGARMGSGHNGLALEDVRTRWPSVERHQEMKAQCRKKSGYKEHGGCVTERRQDATGRWTNLPDAASDRRRIQNGSLRPVHPVCPERQTHRMRNKVFANLTTFSR